MKIKKLVIKNYRNLKDISLDFNNLTILIGKNDVGKSNILKVLDLFFSWTESEDFKETSIGGSGNDFEHITNIRDYRLFIDQKLQTIELQGILELNNDEINELFPDIEIKFEKNVSLLKKDIGNEIIISKEIIGKENKKVLWRIDSIRMEDILLYEKEDKKYLVRNTDGIYSFSGGGENIAVKLLNLLKRKFLLIPAVRNIEKEGRVGNPASLDGKFIPNEFLRYEKNISLNKKQIFEQINKDVFKIFSEYKNIASMEDSESNIETYFDLFPSSSVGSGIKQQFINIFGIDSYKNVIFGIEEPEIHLHPEAQRKVFDFLKEKSKEEQIIITTHSPIFVDCLNEIKIYLIKKEQDKIAELKLIEDKEEFRSIKYELGAKNTDLFFYNAIVLIEGDTEERAFPIIANVLGHDLNKLGIKIINIEGKDKIKRIKIKEFLKYIKDSDVKSFILLDKDDGAESDIQDLIRAGLLREENYHIWNNGDFEDCFSEEQIIDAMKKIHGEDFNITSEELKELREGTNPTSKILSDLLYKKKLGPLNKPALGEELALTVKTEMKNFGGIERQKIEPEEVIEKIIELLED